MLVSKKNLQFDTIKGDVFLFKAGVLYSNDKVPEWVVRTQNFKDAKAKNLISGDYEEKKTLDTDLIKRANFLEINFSKEIEEAALEALVNDKEASRQTLIEALKEKGETAAGNAKISTLQAKLDLLNTNA